MRQLTLKTDKPPLTPKQLRLARKLLGWSSERVSMMSNTPLEQVRAFELTGEVVTAFWQPSDLEGLRLIRAALEEAGVEFTEWSGGGAGVRLRREA